MTTRSSTFFTREPESLEAGRAAGAALHAGLGGEPLGAVIVYATMNHEHPALLQGLREAIGPHVPVIGCSAQGVVGNDELTEDGLAVGAMGFGGAGLHCSIAAEHDIQVDSFEKGCALARRLKAELDGHPKIVVVHYDPLCGADVEALLRGMRTELSCPLMGAGAGQPWGLPVQTFQYTGREVFSRGAVALALTGSFELEIDLCSGTVPTGVAMTVTGAEGNRLLELDGRPAAQIWYEATGASPDAQMLWEYMASWAIGVERRHEIAGPDGPVPAVAHMIRGAFGFDKDDAVILQAAVAEGTRVMFHHRTVDQVLKGTEKMAADLAARLGGRRPWAVLGFECAARTFPFLGAANTLSEHRSLRAMVAPDSPWLGMMAWGEIAPLGGSPAFHNYTYPLVAFMEAGR